MTKITKEPTGSFSPFYGCAIMAMAALMFGGIVGWSLYTLTKQDSAIAKFTVEQPAPPARQSLSVADQAAFITKLNAFAQDATAGKPVTLVLSLPELNTLIDLAPDTGYGNFKEMIAFTSLKPGDSLVANVSLPLNKLKYWEGKRYAVGEATFVTEMSKDKDGGPDLRLTALTIPGKDVSTGFIDAFASWHWLSPYHKLPAFEPVMKAVKKISVTEQGVVLSTVP
ncbi:MAG: hypothetical protein JWO94_3562 [Verrucomicrobiaceae bacterium]|nr:hypothetical protein [Verrucomicrobiaceae bacterium]